MQIKFFYGELDYESVDVPPGNEAIRDVLEDNRGLEACDRLLQYITEFRKSENSSWEMSYNSSYVKINGDKVNLESQWEDSDLVLDLEKFILLLKNWRSFLSEKSTKEKIYTF